MINDATATIDRAGLALPDLVVRGKGDGPYTLRAGFQIPAGVWRRTFATAPYVHGRLLTGAVLEQAEIPMPVRAQAATPQQLHQLVVDLVEAISQFTYTLTLDLDGVVTTWSCEPADYAPGGDVYYRAHTSDYRQHVQLTVPVYPISGAG